MSLDLQQLRDGVRRILGVDAIDPGWADTDVDLLLNESFWEISDAFDFRIEETSTSQVLVAGTRQYNLVNPLVSIKQISIEDLNSNQHSNLEPMDVLVYEQLYANTPSAEGKPTNYVRRGQGFTVWPTPNNAYTLIIYTKETLGSLASEGPTTIPEAWHEVIKYGAGWRGFIALGDYNRSSALQKVQLRLMSTKEEPRVDEKADRAYAGVRIIRPRYR